MAAVRLLILSLACLCAHGLPTLELNDRDTIIPRNTIFTDERFKGEIFENVDAFDNIEMTTGSVNEYRLPTTTRPSHYNVIWTLDFGQNPPTQSGTVDIQLYATQSNVSEIVIHTNELTLLRVELRLGTVLIPTSYEEDTTLHFLRVQLNDTVLNYNAATPVIYTLSIDFGANLRDDMYGIYRTWYRNAFNETVRWMASTQFQATAARQAFPCYDEPSFKATFDATIRRPIGYSSWFCTRLKETNAVVNAPTFQDDVYHTTPVMSTYLLALIVAEYKSLEVNNTQGQLMYEVIARPGAIDTDQGQYALDVGQALLAELSNHTAYDYYSQHPELKMTQASIPDFGAGAMENWGLLTYREAYLMYDEEETNSHFKQIIAYILSHEIAHMWFGNLVTCDWWDVLWLNEGFARYYQYFLTYWVEDMGFETRFVTEQVHTALLGDSANNPHPLSNPGVGSPASVSAMFSTISYNKGAAIIRMSEHLLGFEVAREGLRNYLRELAFKTALPIDLFEYQQRAGVAAGALNYGADFSYVDYYKSWTEQSGHPVLNVHVNHQTGEMTIYQRRFNINTGYSGVNTNYIVPITFATASNPDFSDTKPTHIISKAVTIINRGTTGDEWVIFNKQQTGFYRVNYDDYTWDLIILALRGNARTSIHEFNRAQIVNDVFQFARSGLMSYTRAFNILSFLEFETDYAPWVAAMTGFSWLRNRLASTSTTTQLNELNARIASWATNVMASLTYQPIANESFMRSYLRLQLAPVMCNIGVTACLESARTQLTALQSQGVAVPVDSRNWVYCNGLRQGDASTFNYLWQRFQEHNVYTEKILLLQTLGCTRDATSLNTFMAAIVDDNYIIRPQDYTTAFNSAVTGNEENTEIALTFIQNNLARVAAAFGGSVRTPMSYVTARFRSVDRITQFRQWADQNAAALGNDYNSVVSDAEATRQSIAWAESVQTDISSYLQTGNTDVTTSTAAPVVTTVAVTTQQPALAEPVTPSLPAPPDSAATTFVSLFALTLGVLANFLM